MPPATPELDEQLAQALDEALAEREQTGEINLQRLRERHNTVADELPDLLRALHDLDTAIADWKGMSTPAGLSPGAPPEPLPERIGRYRVQARLGVGGMGTVYKADDPELQRVVAIKVPRFDGAPETRRVRMQRFLREARVAARIRHPHVCPIYDVGDEGGTPYVVMQCIEGQSLAERLQGRRRLDDEAEAIELTRQVAEALSAVHAHGIIHRDLKPGNILLSATGDRLSAIGQTRGADSSGPMADSRKPIAVLTDFGLARPEDDTEHLTTEGTLPGTPAYMAPEQMEGQIERIGPWTDLYSLGVVLYQMLTGRLPFEGPALTILRKVGQEAPASPFTHRADLTPALEAIVMQAIAVNPQDRFQNSADLIDALDGLSDERGRHSPQLAKLGRGMVRQLRTRRMLWVAAALLLLGLGIGLCWSVFWNPDRVGALDWAAAGITWKKLTSMRLPRNDMMLAEIDGSIYVIGGVRPGVFASTVEVYHPGQDRWEDKPPLPEGKEIQIETRNGPARLRISAARWRGSLVAMQQKLYLLGGWAQWLDVERGKVAQNLPVATLLVGDAKSGEWSFGPDIPFPQFDKGLPGSESPLAGVIDEKLYLYTAGIGSNEFPGSYFHVFDPATQIWESLSTPKNYHHEAAGAVIDGKLYVVGGHDRNNEPVATLELYDSKETRREQMGWRRGKPMPTARSSLAAVAVGGKLFVLGGTGTSEAMETVEIYDPATDTWTQGPPLTTPRRGHAAIAVGNTIYVFGGGAGEKPPYPAVEALDVTELLKRLAR